MVDLITVDTDFGKVTWAHHPLFDEPRTTNVLPPYQYAPADMSPIEIIIHDSFYWILLKKVLDKKLTLVDQTDISYQILALRHHDDFFSPMYSAIIMRTESPSESKVNYVELITDLRESLISSTAYMMQMMQETGMIIYDSHHGNNGQGLLPMITLNP